MAYPRWIGRRITRTLLAVSALGLAALLPLAAAQEVAKEVLDAAKQEGKVMIYGSIESQIMEAVQKAFEAKYGIKTQYWRASSTKVLDRVLTETRAGKPLFDVALTNATPMKILKQEGVFAQYLAPASAAFPAKVQDPEGILSPPYRVVVISILYNSRLVKAEEAPKTLKDLLDPKWRGKIVMPDPTRHSTTATWLVNLEKVLGKEWKPFLEGLAAQQPILVESFLPSVRKVIAGEAPLGITYVKYIHVMGKKEGAPLDYVRLDPVLGDVHHIAVGANAQHPNAAKLFVNFFISREGLKTLASEGEFVLVKGVYPPIPDAEKLEIVGMDDLSGNELKKWRAEFKKIFFSK